MFTNGFLILHQNTCILKKTHGMFNVIHLINGAVKWAVQNCNKCAALMKCFYKSLHMHL